MNDSPPPVSGAVRRARLATTVMFLVNGAVLATWVSRIPAIKRDLGLSDGQLGLALLGMAFGALIAFPVAGALIARLGSRRITTIAGVAYCAALPLLALSGNLTELILAMVAFGAFNGAMDVAMNAHGVEVEAHYGRSILSSFHGMFSLGGLSGAALGGLIAGIGVNTDVHFLVVAVALGAVLLLAAPQLWPSQPAPQSDAPLFALPSRALLGFGIIAFCAHLSEGAMADWSAVYLRETLGAEAAFAALGYAAFSLTMMLARFSGDHLVSRLGPVRLVRFGGLIAGVGMTAALLVGNPLFTLIGFACVGLGLATVTPLVFSAAGRTPGVSPGTAIAAVATMGYSGFLAGPPLIGFLSEGVTLRVSLAVIAVLGFVIAWLSGQVRRAQTPGAADQPVPDVEYSH